jgi:hypothetical protein
MGQGLSTAGEGIGDLGVEQLGTLPLSTAPTFGTPLSYTPGVYNPLSVGETTLTLADNTVASGFLDFLSGVGEAKLLWDAGVFVGAFIVCGSQ